MNGKMVLDVALLNQDSKPIYIYGELLWGPGGGLIVHIEDEKGRELRPPFMDDTLYPPSSDSDLTPFVKLQPNHFLGTRRIAPVQDLIIQPGKYKLRVEYRSPILRNLMAPNIQALHSLWHEDDSVFSDFIPIVVNP